MGEEKDTTYLIGGKGENKLIAILKMIKLEDSVKRLKSLL